jgi:hypothetical protein
MSLFSPYGGADDFEPLGESHIGTPPWDREDASLNLGLTPASTSTSLKLPSFASCLKTKGTSIKLGSSPHVIFKDEIDTTILSQERTVRSASLGCFIQISLLTLTLTQEEQEKSSKDIATPFGTFPTDEEEGKTNVVTGSAHLRTRVKIELEDSDTKEPTATPKSCLRGTKTKADLSLHHIDSITVKFGSPVQFSLKSKAGN